MADKTQFRVVPVQEMIPLGWRLATNREVKLSKPKVTGILGTWTIAKLQDGWKIDGSGYGNKIMKYSTNEEIGDQVIIKLQEEVKEVVIVRPEEVKPDEERYLDLHETCDKGHSMHHFHGRPPRRDLTTRYRP